VTRQMDPQFETTDIMTLIEWLEDYDAALSDGHSTPEWFLKEFLCGSQDEMIVDILQHRVELRNIIAAGGMATEPALEVLLYLLACHLTKSNGLSDSIMSLFPVVTLEAMLKLIDGKLVEKFVRRRGDGDESSAKLFAMRMKEVCFATNQSLKTFLNFSHPHRLKA